MEKRNQVSTQLELLDKCFFIETTIVFWYVANMLYSYTKTINKIDIQHQHLIKLKNYTALSRTLSRIKIHVINNNNSNNNNNLL